MHRLAALLSLLIAVAFLAHGAALAAGAADCAFAAPTAADDHHHHAGDEAGKAAAHDVCCSQACAIAIAMPAEWMVVIEARPAGLYAAGVPAPQAAEPFRIERPPRPLLG